MPWAMNMLASWASRSIAPCLPTHSRRTPRRPWRPPGNRCSIQTKHDGCPFCDLRSRHARASTARKQSGLTLPKGRSPALEPRNPRLHQIAELTTAGHQHFVGRTWELAGLGAEFIGSRDGAEVKPVAVITGLGGMGKTALTAEVLALWESRFEWVLLYQAKPNALGFEATLRDIHMKLNERAGPLPRACEGNGPPMRSTGRRMRSSPARIGWIA